MTLSLLSAEETSLDSIRLSARAGEAEAQFELATRHRDGRGVEKSDGEALHWGHRAADQGHGGAMDLVGVYFLRGSAIPRNPSIAFAYFEAAANESTQAAFNLGQCYFGAQGTKQDCAKALAIWEEAAER